MPTYGNSFCENKQIFHPLSVVQIMACSLHTPLALRPDYLACFVVPLEFNLNRALAHSNRRYAYMHTIEKTREEQKMG
jgi:hypothetical protein